MAVSDLKKLTPEERIAKLKELEAQKKKEIELQKKEIEDAEKEIKNAETELNETKKIKEKVPIPEAIKDDLEGLSEEGKEILKEQKGLKKSVAAKEEVEEKKSSKGKDKEASLEETIASEKFTTEKFAEMQHLQAEYNTQLSQRPMKELYTEMVNIYKRVEEKGYVNPEEQRRAQYLSSAVEQKLEAVDEGVYTMSQELERSVSLVKQLSEGLRGMYKSGRKQNELYRS